MRRLLAWLKRQFAPTVPAARAARQPDDTPPPAQRVRFARCRRCGLLVDADRSHECRPHWLEGAEFDDR